MNKVKREPHGPHLLATERERQELKPCRYKRKPITAEKLSKFLNLSVVFLSLTSITEITEDHKLAAKEAYLKMDRCSLMGTQVSGCNVMWSKSYSILKRIRNKQSN